MKDKYSEDDVVTISGTIWNDSTRTVANAANINADILKNVLSRLEKLEEISYPKCCKEAAERI